MVSITSLMVADESTSVSCTFDISVSVSGPGGNRPDVAIRHSARGDQRFRTDRNALNDHCPGPDVRNIADANPPRQGYAGSRYGLFRRCGNRDLPKRAY